MNRKIENVPVASPPAIDEDESQLAARNEFLAENEFSGADDFEDTAAGEEETKDEIALDEDDAAPGSNIEQAEAENLRRTKRRKSFAFVGAFGSGLVVVVLCLSWAFGFGFFAPAGRVAVDRNQKANNLSSPVTTGSGDEKLKTALALVADDAGNDQNSPVISDSSSVPNSVSEQDLKLSSGEKTGEQPNNLPSGNMIVLPDENEGVKSNRAQNQTRTTQPLSKEVMNNSATPSLLAASGAILQSKANNNGGNLTEKSDSSIRGRSVFFGSVPVKKDSRNSFNQTGNFSPGRVALSNQSSGAPAFGTLLPVRILGAIYTLRGSGGLVRMELSRAIKKGEFSYPAGTVIVGRLRGSETNRAFVSAIGAIDPKSGKLVKFEGELMGIDGASGVSGERKSIKSWGSRFLSGLREAGGQAVNIVAARGGRGGTIVLGGTSGLGGEMSSIVRGNSLEDNNFVVVKAGTEAYVLVTGLPAEQRSDDANEIEKLAGNNQLPGINLSEPEMAEILTTSDPNKIRAALLKMSPGQRAPAIKAVEGGR